MMGPLGPITMTSQSGGSSPSKINPGDEPPFLKWLDRATQESSSDAQQINCAELQSYLEKFNPNPPKGLYRQGASSSTSSSSTGGATSKTAGQGGNTSDSAVSTTDSTNNDENLSPDDKRELALAKAYLQSLSSYIRARENDLISLPSPLLQLLATAYAMLLNVKAEFDLIALNKGMVATFTSWLRHYFEKASYAEMHEQPKVVLEFIKIITLLSTHRDSDKIIQVARTVLSCFKDSA